MVQGGMKCVKYSLFLINLLFVIAGIILIAIGVATKNGINQFGGLVLHTTQLNAPAHLFIGVGAVVFIIAFLGCCGAVRENHCMMMTYSVLIGLILILEIGAAVTAYYMEDEMKDVLAKGLDASFNEYGNNTAEGEEIRRTWALVQSDLHCCGARNYTDWFDVTMFNTTEHFIPTSCCREGDHENCTQEITPRTSPAEATKIVWAEGCIQKGLDNINIGRIGTVGITLAVVELLAIMTACFMARSIRYSYETV